MITWLRLILVVLESVTIRNFLQWIIINFRRDIGFNQVDDDTDTVFTLTISLEFYWNHSDAVQCDMYSGCNI